MNDYFPGSGLSPLDLYQYGAASESYGLLALLIAYLLVVFVTKNAMAVVVTGVGLCLLEVIFGIIPLEVAVYCLMVNVLGAVGIANFSKVGS